MFLPDQSGQPLPAQPDCRRRSSRVSTISHRWQTEHSTTDADGGSGVGQGFETLHHEVLDRLGSSGKLVWSAAVLDATSVRAKSGSLTGSSRVDRGKKTRRSRSVPMQTGPAGCPCVRSEHPRQHAAAIDGGCEVPTIRSVSRVGGGPGGLRADEGYDYGIHRRWLCERGIVPRSTRHGINRNDRLVRCHAQWRVAEHRLALKAIALQITSSP